MSVTPEVIVVRSSERRAHQRTPLDVFANRFLDGYPYLCRTSDISLEGLRLRRLNEPAVDETPRTRFTGLQFQLPGSDEILTASGEVVSHDDEARSLGVRFTQLAPQTAAALRRFLAARAAVSP
jgi:c-di-GMP-binding flagellar brake protein YcgR